MIKCLRETSNKPPPLTKSILITAQWPSGGNDVRGSDCIRSSSLCTAPAVSHSVDLGWLAVCDRPSWTRSNSPGIQLKVNDCATCHDILNTSADSRLGRGNLMASSIYQTPIQLDPPRTHPLDPPRTSLATDHCVFDIDPLHHPLWICRKSSGWSEWSRTSALECGSAEGRSISSRIRPASRVSC